MQEFSFAHVAMGLARESDPSVTQTQDEFAQNLKPLPASPQLGAARQKTLSTEDTEFRQCELGELCRLSTVSRPDICAHLARIASRVNSLRGSGVYRITDLARTAAVWRQAAVLKYLASPHMSKHAKGSKDGKVRQRWGDNSRVNYDPRGMARW